MAGAAAAKSDESVVLVTGPSGAGRTTAIQALEDLGYETIDNLPMSLLPRLLEGPPVGALALGCDPRTRGFSVPDVLAAAERHWGPAGIVPVVLYIDCTPAVLVRRYSETRRRHPSSPDAQPLVGIEREVAMLAPLRARADVLIDTSTMSPHDLRAEIARQFGSEGRGELAVTLQSFAFKRGAPAGVDMMMDVRFLRNPHWVQGLRPFDGRDPPVADYVAEDPNWAPFMARLEDMLLFLLPAYRAEGKSYFTLAVGCTGGRHRSVAVVETLAKALAREGWQVSISHKDLVDSAGTATDLRAEVGVQ